MLGGTFCPCAGDTGSDEKRDVLLIPSTLLLFADLPPHGSYSCLETCVVPVRNACYQLNVIRIGSWLV